MQFISNEKKGINDGWIFSTNWYYQNRKKLKKNTNNFVVKKYISIYLLVCFFLKFLFYKYVHTVYKIVK